MNIPKSNLGRLANQILPINSTARIENVSSKFENQISKVIISWFYALKPHVVYNIRIKLPSAFKDSVPTQKKLCSL